eukprot:TRINITY_DN11558_c0_g1_i1.p1 TRINITY_DN11558_c0_g1~~TRINITY_DN11558_c0_g1_i1.p1  ORF type:complete len:209 (+),score=37.02 TRINITY_DN11558_c0_g1_i1:65-691(+)
MALNINLVANAGVTLPGDNDVIDLPPTDAQIVMLEKRQLALIVNDLLPDADRARESRQRWEAMMSSVGPQGNGQAIQQFAAALQAVQGSIQQMQQQMQQQIESVKTMIDCKFENESRIRRNRAIQHSKPLRALRKYRPGHPQGHAPPAYEVGAEQAVVNAPDNLIDVSALTDAQVKALLQFYNDPNFPGVGGTLATRRDRLVNLLLGE